MKRKEAIISIRQQITAATGRAISDAYVARLLTKNSGCWEVNFRGVIYRRLLAAGNDTKRKS